MCLQKNKRVWARPLLKWHLANLLRKRDGENEVATKILPEVLVMGDLPHTHAANLNPETGVLPCTHGAKQSHQTYQKLEERQNQCDCRLPPHRPLKQKLVIHIKIHLKMWAAAGFMDGHVEILDMHWKTLFLEVASGIAIS